MEEEDDEEEDNRLRLSRSPFSKPIGALAFVISTNDPTAYMKDSKEIMISFINSNSDQI